MKITLHEDIPKGTYEISGLTFTPVPPVKPPVKPPEPPKPEPPRPEPPKPEPPKPDQELIEKLRSAFTDPSQWTAPEQVWDFGELSGGAFIPIARNHFIQQDRDGGKIRVIYQGKGRNMFIYDNLGVLLDGEIHDAKFYDDNLYATVVSNKRLYIAICKDMGASKLRLNVEKEIVFEGAKDTSHALLKTEGGWNIYGRLRAVDWITNNPILKDRRGVRMIELDNNLNVLHNYTYLDPAVEQHNYATNQMRYDYYATRVILIEGIEVLGISVFAKNEKRVPSTRPDRITGTGEIYPIVALNGMIQSHTNTPIRKSLHARRTEWKESHPYEPEVGQCYCYGITYKDGVIDFYYSHRQDTHYLVDADTASRMKSCKVYRISCPV
jgi:hypothetical protein